MTAGLYYVIDGFLDILLPEKEEKAKVPVKVPEQDDIDADNENEPWRTPSLGVKQAPQKLLFTVKPGGIAGYLGEPCTTVWLKDYRF